MSHKTQRKPLCARWTQLPTTLHSEDANGVGKLLRSSHALTIIDDHVYIFGGEMTPRVPTDNTMYIYNLLAKHWETPVFSKDQDPGNIPEPRVGATSAAIGHLIFVWGGRGGPEMAPLPNDLFEFDTIKRKWCKLPNLNPGLSDPPPEARSYHAMTASKTHLYIHGGCSSSGRLNDLHSYNPLTNRWTTLPTSTDISPRGGSALVYHHPQNKLFLFGGFNGKTETDDLRVFDVATNKWHEPKNLKSDDIVTPRSVHGFVSLPKKNLLVAMYGERDPSPIGHAGAGKFWDDVWALRINADADNSWKELAIEWDRVEILDEEEKISSTSFDEIKSRKPTPRGWFQVAEWNEKIVLSGGLNGDNERLDDLWVLEFV